MHTQAGNLITGELKPFVLSQFSKVTLFLLMASLPVFTGCAAVQVHLGMKVYLAKTPVTAIEVRQAKSPGIGPGKNSSLIATVTETAGGKVLETEGAGGGKVMWRDLTVTTTVVTVNKKGVISLPRDPRVSAGKLPHVSITIPSHPGLTAELDIPLRYDYKFGSNFNGSSGASGMNGSDGLAGSSGSMGSTDPNNPSPGGNGGNGTDGSDGQDGSPGGDAPPVQIQMTLAPGGDHPLVEFGVFAAGHQRYYLVDPNGGSLTVTANGGSGGQGGKGGRGGSGGSGGIGTPNGSDGMSGHDGRDGMSGSDGRGGSITVTYDPSTQPYLSILKLSNTGGPKPVLQEGTVAPLW